MEPVKHVLDDLSEVRADATVQKPLRARRALLCEKHELLKALTGTGTQDIRALYATQRPNDGDVVIMSCEVRNLYSEEETDEFRAAIFQTLQDNGTEFDILQENILLQSEGGSLKKKISDEIERKIISGFQKIDSSLQRFDQVEDGSSQKGNILETSEVINSVHGFLRNPSIFREITSFKAREKGNEEFLNSVIFRLCRLIKCAAVSPLAKKYSLRSEVCNQLLHEVNFEEALARAFSKNTLHHLRKLEQTESHNCYKFDFLLSLLQTDMKQIFGKAEEKLSSMKRFSMVVRRLLFETDGYLKQSTIESESRTEASKMPAKLRRDILNIKGVYGIGTIYGRLEIHLDNEEELDTATESSNDQMEDDVLEQMKISKPDIKVETGIAEDKSKKGEHEKKPSDLRSRIASVMNKHSFHYPYTVRLVRNKPIELSCSFEPGDTLLSRPSNKTGTVGAFGNTKDGTIYGLTCAHVVAGSGRVFVDKDGKYPFSCFQQIVRTGQDQCPLIDIAALKVIPCLQDKCKENLENNEELVKKVDIATDSPEKLVGRFVHKFGAKTNLTKGIIISVDYSKFGPNAADYIVIIDPLAGNRSEGLLEVSRAFTSLLVSTQQARHEQNAGIGAAEEMYDVKSIEDVVQEEQMQTEKTLPNTKNKSLDVSEYPKHKRRKLENIASSAKLQELSNLTDSVRVVVNRNETALCTNAMLYVRNINETGIDNCDSGSVFAERGDSGSVICAQDLFYPGRKYVAVSMLSAGDLEVGGLDGKKALSFMLKDGLAKLNEHCQIEFS